MKNKEVIFCIFLLIGIFSILMFVQAESDTMIVEANFLQNEIVVVIGIDVPDNIFLGNVTKGEKSDEVEIELNNTGNVAITVTPQLSGSPNQLFDYLSFRKRKTGDSSNSSWIGNYSQDLEEGEEDYFWMVLDLTNYEGDINQDMISEQADIIFWATEQ